MEVLEGKGLLSLCKDFSHKVLYKGCDEWTIKDYNEFLSLLNRPQKFTMFYV